MESLKPQTQRLIKAIFAGLVVAGILLAGTSDISKFFSYAISHQKENKAATLVALLQAPPPAPFLPVERVVDGDTIDVAIDGGVATIRMIGVNTPEVVDPRKPVQCFGLEASAKAHELLDGSLVRLELDQTQDTYDRYGRVLAYVFLADGTLFNQLMIEEGYAHEYTYDLPYKYQKEFRAAQKLAKKEGRGLWAPGVCN